MKIEDYLKSLFIVFAGTGLGVAFRALPSIFINTKIMDLYYLIVLLSNIIASFFIVFVYKYIKSKNLKLFLSSGLLGGLSTFSSIFVYSNKNIDIWVTIVYPLLTFSLGIAICVLSKFLIRKFK